VREQSGALQRNSVGESYSQMGCCGFKGLQLLDFSNFLKNALIPFPEGVRVCLAHLGHQPSNGADI